MMATGEGLEPSRHTTQRSKLCMATNYITLLYMAVYKGNAPFSVAWQTTILTFELIDHIILKFTAPHPRFELGSPLKYCTLPIELMRHKSWGRQPSYNLRLRCLWSILPNLPSSSCFSRQHRAVLWRSL